jgi:hypothetical protein
MLASAKDSIAQGVESVKERVLGKEKEEPTMGEKVGAKVDEAAAATSEQKAKATEAVSKQKAKASEAIASGADKVKEKPGKGEESK